MVWSISVHKQGEGGDYGGQSRKKLKELMWNGQGWAVREGQTSAEAETDSRARTHRLRERRVSC